MHAMSNPASLLPLVIALSAGCSGSLAPSQPVPYYRHPPMPAYAEIPVNAVLLRAELDRIAREQWSTPPRITP